MSAAQQSAYPLEIVQGFLDRVESRFPGLQIDELHPRGEWSIVSFLWDAQSAVRAGLLAPEELPAGRKRLYFTVSPFHMEVIKRRKGWIEVSARIPPDVPADHPLAFFSVASVRSNAPVPRPSYLRLVVDNTREVRP